MAELIFFYLFSVLAVTTAFMVVFAKNPVHSVLYLVVTMFSIAALFALLGAHFLAVIQILIYAGAVLVLFLFVIMMLDLGKEGRGMRQNLGIKVFGAAAALVFVVEMLLIIKRAFSRLPAMMEDAPVGDIQTIGRLLFSDHMLAFELASFLMLAAILGAVVLSKKSWS
jgi:NADH-quinone oxidoreductase subunit J